MTAMKPLQPGRTRHLGSLGRFGRFVPSGLRLSGVLAISLLGPLGASAQQPDPNAPAPSPSAPPAAGAQAPGQGGGQPAYPQYPGYPQYPSYPQYPQGYPQYPGYQQYPPQYPAQVPPGGQAPQPGPVQGQGYPQPYPGYPPQGYPQQAYPPGAYPQAYPQQPAPPAAQVPQPQLPPQAPPAPDAKLVLSTPVEEAKAPLAACLDAHDNYRTETARLRCGEAAAKDDKLALALAVLAQLAATPAQAQKRLGEVQEALSRRPPSEPERLLIEAFVAQVEDRRPAARAALDALVAQVPGERRAYYYRGLLRYRFGDVEGALADFGKATELDAKYGPAYNALGHLQLRRDKLDEAQKAFEKYAEVQPKEANAHDSLAILHLRKNELGPAVESARKALELDPKFLKANARLGDALLFQGNPVAARRAYAALMASADPAEHHDGAMRSARSRLLDTPAVPTPKQLQDAEKDFLAEAEAAKKLRRRADRERALLELARVQIERGALAEAAQTVQLVSDGIEGKDELAPEADADKGKDAAKEEGKAAAPEKPSDKPAVDKSAPTLTEDEKARFQAEVLGLRALLLGSIGEPVIAEERAGAIEKTLRGKPGEQRAREVRGDLAARAGDRQAVVKHLTGSQRATAKLALALALGGGKAGEQIDAARGRSLMEELAKRNVNDLEAALTRARARAWLKANPAPAAPAAGDAKKSEAKQG